MMIRHVVNKPVNSLFNPFYLEVNGLCESTRNVSNNPSLDTKTVCLLNYCNYSEVKAETGSQLVKTVWMIILSFAFIQISLANNNHHNNLSKRGPCMRKINCT